MVLAATKQVSEGAIAAELGTTRHRVTRWREWFEAGGIEALKKDLPGGGRAPSIDAAKIKQIVQLTTQTTPKQATQWSTRLMAERVGVNDTTVLRVWHAHGLKPHRVQLLKLSSLCCASLVVHVMLQASALLHHAVVLGRSKQLRLLCALLFSVE